MASDWLFYPYFLHLHFKRKLPTNFCLGKSYGIELCISNEIDMFRSIDLNEVAEEELVVYFTVLNCSSQMEEFYVTIDQKTKPVIGKNGRCNVDIVISGGSIANKTSTLKIVAFTKSKRILAACQTIMMSNSIAELSTFAHDHVLLVKDETDSFKGKSVKNPLNYVFITEYAGATVGSRIWDSALYLRIYLLRILQQNPNFFHKKSILDIGSGTGVLAIWLYRYLLSYTESETDIVLSDLPELVELMNANIENNVVYDPYLIC